MKINDFFKKNKIPVVIFLVILCVLMIGISIFIIKIWRTRSIPAKSNTIGGITDFDSELLIMPNDIINQSYSINDLKYDKLGIFLNMFSVNNDDSINVTISNGTTELKKVLRHSDIIDSGYTYLELPKDFRLDNASVLEVELTTNSTEGFVVHTNKSVVVENSHTTLNGDPIDDKIVIDLKTDKNTNNYQLYIVFLVCSIIFLFLLAFLVYNKNFTVEFMTAIVLLFFGIFYMFIFTPYSVPDEPLHYYTAYHVSNEMMLDFNDESMGLRMRNEDYSFCNSAKIAISAEEYNFISENNHAFCTDNEITVTNFPYLSNKEILYIAPSIGITFARVIGLSAYWTFQTARFFNFILFVVSVYFAIKMIPIGKIAMYSIATIPITMHIMASNSYDVFSLSGILLFFAYFMKLMYSDVKIGWKQLLILSCMIFFVIPQKIVYIGVAAVVLLLPKRNFKNPRLHFLFKCLLGLVAIAGALVFQWVNMIRLNNDTTLNAEVTKYSLSYVLQSKKEILAMLLNTIFVQSDFYLKSIISYFGWFQLELPWFLTIPVIIVVLISFMRKENEPAPLNLISKSYVFVLICIVFLLTELILLIDHTPLGSSVILGVQGRYFTPALPLVYLLLRNKMITLKETIDGQLIFTISIINVIIVFFLLSMILG